MVLLIQFSGMIACWGINMMKNLVIFVLLSALIYVSIKWKSAHFYFPKDFVFENKVPRLTQPEVEYLNRVMPQVFLKNNNIWTDYVYEVTITDTISVVSFMPLSLLQAGKDANGVSNVVYVDVPRYFFNSRDSLIRVDY